MLAVKKIPLDGIFLTYNRDYKLHSDLFLSSRFSSISSKHIKKYLYYYYKVLYYGNYKPTYSFFL